MAKKTSKARRRHPGESDESYQRRMRRLDAARERSARNRATEPVRHDKVAHNEPHGAFKKTPSARPVAARSVQPEWVPLQVEAPPYDPDHMSFFERERAANVRTQNEARIRAQEQQQHRLNEMFERVSNASESDMIDFPGLVLWCDGRRAVQNANETSLISPADSLTTGVSISSSIPVPLASDYAANESANADGSANGGDHPFRGGGPPVRSPPSADAICIDPALVEQPKNKTPSEQLTLDSCLHTTPSQAESPVVLNERGTSREGDTVVDGGTGVTQAIGPASSGAQAVRAGVPAERAALPVAGLTRCIRLPVTIAAQLLITTYWLVQSRTMERLAGTAAAPLTLRYGKRERQYVAEALEHCYAEYNILLRAGAVLDDHGQRDLGFEHFACMLACFFELRGRAVAEVTVEEVADFCATTRGDVAYHPAMCATTTVEIVAVYRKHVAPELHGQTFAIISDIHGEDDDHDDIDKYAAELS